jgi:hypothetical protein
MDAGPGKVFEPQSYEEALNCEDRFHWLAAINAELNSLLANDTWELEERPANCRPIGVKWVFKVKYDSNGKVERYKARLVAKGFSQREGIDYNEVFAPVSKHTTLRMLLAMVAAEDLELLQVDVTTAFLHGKLDEEIYIDQPKGLELPGGYVCRLKKAIYGLKQAPRAWREHLQQNLEKLGFTVSELDPALFILRKDGKLMFLLTHVDDFLLAASDRDWCELVISDLQKCFPLRNLGDAQMFTGIEIMRNRVAHTIKIHQHRNVYDLLEKYRYLEAKPSKVPMDPGMKLVKEGEPMADPLRYSGLVGSLLYLSICSRPDIAQAVGVLTRYMAKPAETHWTAALQVLRYLTGTRHDGITYGLNPDDIIGYCDADFAGDLDTRRSTTGYIFRMFGGAISWSSRLQVTVAASTTEAEYMAASAACKEALWLRSMYKELGMNSVKVDTMLVYGDNQAALKILKNAIVSQRSKHIDVMYHFTRQHIERGVIEFQYIRTDSMVADCLTKALTLPKFMSCKSGMGVN